jgi:hypothetical protein
MRKTKIGIGEAISVVLFLIGTGIQLFWPDQKKLGLIFMIVGGAVGLLIAVWVVAQYFGRKDFESSFTASPLTPQLTQQQSVPINNTNAPVFAPVFAPSFNQSQAAEQPLPKNESVRPEVECTDCYFVNSVLSSWNTLERGEGRPCEVAQADFHLKPIVESDPWIELRTQLIFYRSSGARLRRVADGVWREQGNVIQMPLDIGDTKRLVIALTFENALLSAYEYNEQRTPRPRFLTTGEILHHFLAPKLEQLETTDSTVQVRLIGKYMNQLRLDQEFWFRLSGTDSSIKQVPRPDWANEVLGTAKSDQLV